MNTADISLPSLLLFYFLLLIPLAGFYFLRVPLLKKSLIAAGRMSLQLGFIGLYLKYVFIYNNIWINLLWIGVMVVVANISVTGSTGLRRRRIFFITLLGISSSTFLVVSGLILVAVRPVPFHDARYVIPITGMVLGNCLRGNILVLERFFSDLKSHRRQYMSCIYMGASVFEAVLPYMRNALAAALSPMVSTMATIGLVSLPGMMTGQILGGSSPAVAVKYQIAIMIAIFSAMAISAFVNLALCVRAAFDGFQCIREDLFKPVSRK